MNPKVGSPPPGGLMLGDLQEAARLSRTYVVGARWKKFILNIFGGSFIPSHCAARALFPPEILKRVHNQFFKLQQVLEITFVFWFLSNFDS